MKGGKHRDGKVRRGKRNGGKEGKGTRFHIGIFPLAALGGLMVRPAGRCSGGSVELTHVN